MQFHVEGVSKRSELYRIELVPSNSSLNTFPHLTIIASSFVNRNALGVARDAPFRYRDR